MIWALDELDRLGAAELGWSWSATAVGLHERYLATPDFDEDRRPSAVAPLAPGSLRQTGHILGPPHGFVGPVYVLARGDLLGDDRRAEVELRVVRAAVKYVEREDGLAQSPTSLEPRPGRSTDIRTRWCHGVLGIVASLASIAPRDQELTDLLVAGGELTWRAGQLVKGPCLCHGTARNRHAFLKLVERTESISGSIARAYSRCTSVEQVGLMRRTHGPGRYTLSTGDVGTALYLWSCITATAAVPTIDGF